MIVTKITSEQYHQLAKVPASRDGSLNYKPCQVKLKNGQTFDNVYIQEEKSYFEMWGVMPDQDSGKKYILIEDVQEVKESPNRLPPKLANKLYDAGESGMGYCLYKMILDNGNTIDVCAGNAVDFVKLPAGYTVKNVEEVLPHEGSRNKFIPAAEYYWCIYKTE